MMPPTEPMSSISFISSPNSTSPHPTCSRITTVLNTTVNGLSDAPLVLPMPLPRLASTVRNYPYPYASSSNAYIPRTYWGNCEGGLSAARPKAAHSMWGAQIPNSVYVDTSEDEVEDEPEEDETKAAWRFEQSKPSHKVFHLPSPAHALSDQVNLGSAFVATRQSGRRLLPADFSHQNQGASPHNFVLMNPKFSLSSVPNCCSSITSASRPAPSPPPPRPLPPAGSMIYPLRKSRYIGLEIQSTDNPSGPEIGTSIATPLPVCRPSQVRCHDFLDIIPSISHLN
ncbi:unnamed protein product [Protopolystoma xenopodis]|uniref:Uncharacterized protein n=1 Tax=Protopolystoma xenopodis TaxID=117903 RepID=A0A448X1K9_9PLAT|nr:unnamed protein product [Protopolystoma xenopodis]